MTYGSSKESACMECGCVFPHLKKLSEHIKKMHDIKPCDYYSNHFHGGQRPMCKACGAETRYVSLSEGFKNYCIEHKGIAASESGRVGGKIKETWSRGKTKETDERLLEMSKNMSGENNPFWGKRHSQESKDRNASSHRLNFEVVLKRISEINSNVAVLSTWRSYQSQDSLLSVKCLACDSLDEVSFFNMKRCWRCRTCNPLGSKQQVEISEYVKSLGLDVTNSTRKIIPPLEIDIWVPEKKLAIEYHGLYWHSGGREETFDKKKHRKKYEECQKLGIKLIQVFSDEWAEKNEICRSIIRNSLGQNGTKINARDCSIVDLTQEEAKSFLEKTHISGYTRCKHRVGLIHKELGLVGIATTRTPIQKKWGNLSELARMSFSQNVTVRGGASKLLSRVKQLSVVDGFDGVLSYADLRFGSGSVYSRCGFELVGESPINCWYTDGHKRLDRFLFRAQEGKSEAAVAADAGVRLVWGSGNRVYIWKSEFQK